MMKLKVSITASKNYEDGFIKGIFNTIVQKKKKERKFRIRESERRCSGERKNNKGKK